MKKMKLTISTIGLLTAVSALFAFKIYHFTNPTVFCVAGGTKSGTCPITALVPYVPDPLGVVTTPCSAIAGTTPHGNSNGFCSPWLASTYTINN